MTRYLTSLLQHLEAGGRLVGVPNRPVSQDLVRRVVETCYSGHHGHKMPYRVFPRTELYRIRPGLVINHMIDGRWHTLLGRICHVDENIDSQHRAKTIGGMAKGGDFSIFYSLMREMREEISSFRVKKGSVFPLCVMPSAKGILQFFCGRFKRYPDIAPGEFVAVEESSDQKTLMGYLSMDDLLDEYAKGEDSMVNPETIEAAIESYFWSRGRKLDFNNGFTPGMLRVLERGELEIPSEIREFLLKKTGMPDQYMPDLKRCSVYISVPTQAKALPAAKMLLVTDLFLYEEEFGPDIFEEGDLDRIHEDAEYFVKSYVKSTFERIFLEDIPSMYVR